ncbi:hypothetical protein QUD65_14420 [Lacticaseibacillus paracasei]|uniref:hypothetical protein n=1 Tax=Lacticaseibacillus paracasei TaxID=1597 RepID=UPI0025A02AC6|nr:hypothetical protein [Lacticaseibacillus paracasei]MDM7550853.1 hypothetical protein [Lacticaseibacillus paracasei]
MKQLFNIKLKVIIVLRVLEERGIDLIIDDAEVEDHSFHEAVDPLEESQYFNFRQDANVVYQALSTLEIIPNQKISMLVDMWPCQSLSIPVVMYSPKKQKCDRINFELVKPLKDNYGRSVFEFRAKLSMTELRSISFIMKKVDDCLFLMTYTFHKQRFENGTPVEPKNTEFDVFSGSETNVFLKRAISDFSKEDILSHFL